MLKITGLSDMSVLILIEININKIFSGGSLKPILPKFKKTKITYSKK